MEPAISSMDDEISSTEAAMLSVLAVTCSMDAPIWLMEDDVCSAAAFNPAEFAATP